MLLLHHRNPKPATKPFKFIPKSVNTIKPATTYITTLIIFNRKLSIESSTFFVVLSFIFFTNVDFGIKLAANPFANTITVQISNNFVIIAITSTEIWNGFFSSNTATYTPSMLKNILNGL